MRRMNSFNSWLVFSLAYPYLFCKSPKGCSSFPSTLLCHSAAKHAGNGLNTSFHATEDCGKLKQGYLDPPLNLQLEFFDPDRHIGHSFNPILWAISPHFPNHRNDSFLSIEDSRANQRTNPRMPNIEIDGNDVT